MSMDEMFREAWAASDGDDLASKAARQSLRAVAQTIGQRLPSLPDSAYGPNSVPLPAPGSAQEPADPPWLTEAIERASGDADDAWEADASAFAVRAALPILRAGIERELRQRLTLGGFSIVNPDGSVSYPDGDES